MLRYTSESDRKEMGKEMFNICNTTFVHPALPTIFYFENSTECKLFYFQYADKFAKAVHTNLQVFRSREWDAVVYVDDMGITHVFFGKNETELKLPEVFENVIQGSC